MSKTQGYISITEGTYRRLKEYVERQGVSMSAVVEALMADIGKEQNDDRRPADLNAALDEVQP